MAQGARTSLVPRRKGQGGEGGPDAISRFLCGKCVCPVLLVLLRPLFAPFRREAPSASSARSAASHSLGGSPGSEKAAARKTPSRTMPSSASPATNSRAACLSGAMSPKPTVVRVTVLK